MTMSETEINQIMRALGRIEGKLERVVPLVDAHEKSIDNLNQSESYRRGQSAIISLVVSIATSLASIFIKRAP
jgi:hypothetical protein